MKFLRALFSSKGNALITLAMLALFAWTLPPLLQWAVGHATWDAASRQGCTADGACWAFIRNRFALFFYGRYPVSERWRVDLGMALLLAATIGCLFTRRNRGFWLLVLLVPVPLAGGLLLAGGVPGLPAVETGEWGGLMLNVVLSFVAVAVSLPLGILLAFGRRSTLPVLRWGSTAFIESWRAVPLLAVLFMGLVMLPMFLPNGVRIDILVRAMVVLSLFESAYMAETIRGGLQGVPKGQSEAAMALGMHHMQAQMMVVLPQAMRIAIPGIINIVVDLFKDTTLVSIVGVLDLMGIVTQSLKDQAWLGLAKEGYAFAAVMFFLCCLTFSLAGGVLERRFGQGSGR